MTMNSRLTLGVSRLRAKGLVTIPATVRAFLHLKPGDRLEFSVRPPRVLLGKSSTSLRRRFGFIAFMFSEWTSTIDDEAYRHL